MMELSAETYYKYEKQYRVLQSANRMARFVALDVELCGDVDGDAQPYTGPDSGVEKYALADVQVARESDFGVNDETLCTVTHLGHLVNSGDVVMGYDLAATVGGDWELEESFHNNFVLPDAVLVKKVAGDAVADGDVNDTNESVEGKEQRITKKKERHLRKDGKRARELEESAMRMGFIEGNDHEFDDADMEAELANDPELAAEVSALEREFEGLAASMAAESDADSK